jgi:hypothetical protein
MRAHFRAERAADTQARVRHNGRMKTLYVHYPFGYHDYFFWTFVRAEPAALAPVLVNKNFSQNISLLRKYPFFI